MGACVGASLGAAASYLLLTEHGRRLRTQLEPQLDDLAAEVQRLASAFVRTRQAFVEGWQSINQAMREPHGGVTAESGFEKTH
ncbi:MAG TPA: YtxH domain-containing protein [Vicinamibacterales bacterium]